MKTANKSLRNLFLPVVLIHCGNFFGAKTRGERTLGGTARYCLRGRGLGQKMMALLKQGDPMGTSDVALGVQGS
jgi:hypothetical protein